MRNTMRALLITVVFFCVACDPGMTIRQKKFSDETTKQQTTTGGQTIIDIKTSHVLIGETKYVPQVSITNASDSSITVTSVELISLGTAFANNPRQLGLYPLVVKPRATGGLLVWFDLNNDVKRTFRQPAELRVHYLRDNKNQIASATIVGTPPNADTH